MFIVASLHYCSARVSIFGWTMMYEWGHPVATLPSDGGDYTLLSLNDVNSANQRGMQRERECACGSHAHAEEWLG
eukprot:6213303-Pleurochrysis_carterae.AAC.1